MIDVKQTFAAGYSRSTSGSFVHLVRVKTDPVEVDRTGASVRKSTAFRSARYAPMLRNAGLMEANDGERWVASLAGIDLAEDHFK